jgi:DHA3 family tetracycline resistance protein-like MFS transporter
MLRQTAMPPADPPTTHPALPIYLVMKAGTWLCFTTAFTLSALYRIETVGLDPLQLVLLGTAIEGTIFLCEIPTGAVADTLGRKVSVLCGLALVGAGFLLEGLVPTFAALLLAQCVCGFGFTLTSGAEDAWLADEIGEGALPAAYLRGSQVQQLASLGGIGCAVLFARGGLERPFLAAGVGLLLLAAVLTRTMPETGFVRRTDVEPHSWGALRRTLVEGLGFARKRPLLKLMMAVALVYGLASEGLDRLWENHLLQSFEIPGTLSVTAWFGLLQALAMVLTLAATEALRRRAAHLGPHRLAHLLFALDALRCCALLVFAAAGHFLLAAAAHVTGHVLRHSGRPLFMAWINRGLPSGSRATVLSTVNQMDAAGQLVGGPPLGGLARRFGLRAAMAALAALLLPALPLLGRAASILKLQKDEVSA